MARLRSDLTVSERIKCKVLRLALTLCCWGILMSIAPCPAASSNPQASAPEARAAAPPPVIEWRSDHLSVRLRNAPWAVVLQEVESRTGMKIQVKGPLAGTLTQEFEALPLEQGLRRLFRDANTAFFYATGTYAGTAAGQLTQVWLWPREGRPVEERQIHPSTGDTLPSRPDRALPSGSTPDGPLAPPPARGSAVEPDHEAHLQALEALADADSGVKDYAIQALADRGGDESVGALRLALRDPDPAVRLWVVNHVAPQGQGLTLLREVLADADATVRSVAAARLGEAISEGR